MTTDLPPKILSALLAVLATAVLTLASTGKPVPMKTAAAPSYVIGAAA